MRLADVDREIVRGHGRLGRLLRFRQGNRQIAERCRSRGALAVNKDGKPFADSKAGAVCVIDDAHVVSVIDKTIKRKMADRRAGRNQRLEDQLVIKAGANTDQSIENQIVKGRVVIVVRARQSDDGRACVGIVVLLKIGMPVGGKMLLRVLAQKQR